MLPAVGEFFVGMPESGDVNPFVWISYIALWITYVGVIVGGIVWITYRLVVYLRKERERELSWADLGSDDDFKQYLQTLKDEQSQESGEAAPASNESDTPK